MAEHADLNDHFNAVHTNVSGDKKASPKIRLFLLKSLGLEERRETLSQQEIALMCTNENLKRIEQQARLAHPKVWSKIMMHCTAPILKMYLDDNIKLLERDRKVPQLSDPWVNFCKDLLFPLVAGGKPLRESLMDEFDSDDDVHVAPQDLIDLVIMKGLEWFKAQVGRSNIKSTPQAALNRYFTEDFLRKVADRICPPVKRGVGQRGLGKRTLAKNQDQRRDQGGTCAYIWKRELRYD